MIFEFNDEKDKSNINKHKVSFDEACSIFSNPSVAILFDRHIDGENRYLALGFSNKGNLLMVVHTYRIKHEKESIRIISARKAKGREEKSFTRL